MLIYYLRVLYLTFRLLKEIQSDLQQTEFKWGMHKSSHKCITLEALSIWLHFQIYNVRHQRG
jgi:hypothetical protein